MILVLRNESLDLVRIRESDLVETDIEVELEYGDTFLLEVKDNEEMRSRIGLTRQTE